MSLRFRANLARYDSRWCQEASGLFGERLKFQAPVRDGWWAHLPFADSARRSRQALGKSGKKRPQPAPPGCGLSTSTTAETAAAYQPPAGCPQSLQHCNDRQEKFLARRNFSPEPKFASLSNLRAHFELRVREGLWSLNYRVRASF